MTKEEPGTEPAPAAVPVLRFYAVGLSDAVGLGMYLSLSVLYFDQAVGLSNRDVGFVLGAAGVASLVGAMPIARAAERFGTRNSLTVLFLIRAAAFLALSTVSSFAGAVVVSMVAGLLSRGISPLIEAGLIAKADNATAVGALAKLRTLRNAGLAAGALPAGWAIAVGDGWAYRAVMLGSAVLFVCCAAICRSFPAVGGRESDTEDGQPTRARVLRNRVFLGITTLYGALTLSALLLGVGVPLWIVQQTDAPSWSVTVCQVINTGLVVLLQVRFSRGSEEPRRARAMMLWGGLLSAVAAVAVPLSAMGSAYPALVIIVLATVVFTVAELYIIAGTTGAALQHIPDGQKTGYLATLNLGFAVATVIGPTLITMTVEWGGWAWGVWAGFFTVAGLAALRVPDPVPASTEPDPAGDTSRGQQVTES
ncbi:MAG TPA: MFS transporter [Streptomyces sp.]|nr:MFS transporter [Streptomyces sp.]